MSSRMDRTAPCAESASRTVSLTPDERELLLEDANYAVGAPADNLHVLTNRQDHEDIDTLLAELASQLPRLQAAALLVEGLSRGVLVCDPAVLAIVQAGKDNADSIADEARRSLAKYDEQGPAAYWGPELRSKLTVDTLLEDLDATRQDLEKQTREAALYAEIMARVEQGGED